MPEKMFAAVVTGHGKLSIKNMETSRAKEGLSMRVSYCGVCGSDRRHFSSGDVPEGRIMGHEVVGEIIGSADDIQHWIGKRVAVAPRISCGRCGPCNRGFPNLCEEVRTLGYEVPGGFAQYMHIPRAALEGGNLVELPENLDGTLASLAEPLSCVINGMELSNIQPEDRVTVMGAGPMGLMFVMMAQGKAEEVIVLEPDPERREFSLRHGADRAIPPGPRGLKGSDVTIIACSNPDAYRLALKHVPKGSTVNAFGGLPKGIKIDLNRIHYRQLRIQGTSGSTPQQFRRAVDVLDRNSRFGDLITDVISFDGLQDALSRDPEPGELVLKTVLDPWMG